MRKLGRLLFILLVQGLVVLLLLEVIGRAMDPVGISYYPETARFYDDLELGGPLGYRLPANMDGRYWGTTVRTNSLGMRDRELGPKQDGEHRVMLLGDSVIFSLGVEYEDSIPAHLERRLNAGGGSRYRVLNMGVPSYNTEQELIQLETLGPGLQPDAVMLMFVPNDIERAMWVYEKRSDPVANLAQRSYAASLLFVTVRQLRQAIGGRGSDEAGESAAPARLPPARRAAIEAALSRMTQLLAAQGVPFVVVSRGAPGDAHLDMLREASASSGFRFELLDAEADPHRTTADPMTLMVSRTNTHCNARGCDAIAASLEQILRDKGMLGATAPGASGP